MNFNKVIETRTIEIARWPDVPEDYFKKNNPGAKKTDRMKGFGSSKKEVWEVEERVYESYFFYSTRQAFAILNGIGVFT